jgi:hypothetical protein
VAALPAAVSAAPTPPAPTPPAPTTAGDDPDGPRPYPVAVLAPAGDPDGFAAASATPILAAQIRELLAVEAPIAFASLARRVADAWQLSRVTERVRERLRQALPGDVVVVEDVLWRADGDAATFRGFRVPGDAAPPTRAAEDLPIVEVANAMHWLLRQHVALAEPDLARETARCFGIQRLGSLVRDVMARALAQLLVAGRARRDGDVVRLP